MIELFQPQTYGVFPHRNLFHEYLRHDKRRKISLKIRKCIVQIYGVSISSEHVWIFDRIQFKQRKTSFGHVIAWISVYLIVHNQSHYHRQFDFFYNLTINYLKLFCRHKPKHNHEDLLVFIFNPLPQKWCIRISLCLWRGIFTLKSIDARFQCTGRH